MLKKGNNRIKCMVCLGFCILCLSACQAAESGQNQVDVTPQTILQPEAENGTKSGAGAGMQVTLGEESALLHRTDHGGKFCYEQLSDTEKLWYADMYAIMDGMHTNVTLSLKGNAEIGEAGIDKIFQCVMNDYPELFFVKGYTYTVYTHGTKISKISFSGTYTMTEEERREKQQLIDTAIETALAGIATDASDYEKVKYVYEYVIKSTDYNMDAPDNQNICSVFIGGESVCQGYAKAAQ